MASKKKTATAAKTADSLTTTQQNPPVSIPPAVVLPPIQKMDPRIKTRWVKALRSGNIKQATGLLNKIATKGKNSGKTQGMCCLGVLCDIFSRSKANINGLKWNIVDSRDYVTDEKVLAVAAKFDGEEGMPPQSVAKWAGFEIEDYDNLVVDPSIKIAPLWAIKKYNIKLKKGKVKKAGSSGDGLVALSELNDTNQFSFKDIADIIESYL